MASGRPSRRRQISTTAPTVSSSTAKPGADGGGRGRRTAAPPDARARSSASAWLRGSASGATATSASPAIAERLAAGGEHAQPGQRASSVVGQLGRRRRRGARSCRARAACRCPPGHRSGARQASGGSGAGDSSWRASRRPSASSTAPVTSVGLGDGGELDDPRVTRPPAAAATSIASRVLPAPPGADQRHQPVLVEQLGPTRRLRARGRRSCVRACGRLVRGAGAAVRRRAGRRRGPPAARARGSRPARRRACAASPRTPRARPPVARRRRARSSGGRRGARRSGCSATSVSTRQGEVGSPPERAVPRGGRPGLRAADRTAAAGTSQRRVHSHVREGRSAPQCERRLERGQRLRRLDRREGGATIMGEAGEPLASTWSASTRSRYPAASTRRAPGRAAAAGAGRHE